ncbi:hypothetical protein [Chlamydia gallinacea]|uniref:hypothetical protein n=1 Tax=Chlamydia gallinacea TaxID=1457153 RepID=UPI0024E1F825|nr:hypothetical protein [Chlamydia gallinacea]
MVISGSGNISPSGPNPWDPSVAGKQPESMEGTKKSVFSDVKEATSTSKQEALAVSGQTAMYETEKTINEGKYKKTQEKASTSLKSRLRSKFSKIGASIQGFLSGFGTRASRVSARIAESNGEGRSMLPSSIGMVDKKNNRISPEMRGFYLDASGLGKSSSDISRLSVDSLQSTSLASGWVSSGSISASESSAIASFGPVQTTRAVTSDVVNYWTGSRLGGEMISSLLDPNVETSSLLRRASLIENEGMVDLADLSQENFSTSMHKSSALKNTKVLTTGEDAGKVESLEIDSSYGIVQQSIKENEKKEMQEDLLKEQMAMAEMMASLLTSGASSTVYVPGSFLSSSGTRFPPPRISGTIAKSFYDKKTHLAPGIEKVKSQTDFSFGGRDPGREDGSLVLGSRSESSYRFPREVITTEEETVNHEQSTVFLNDRTVNNIFDPVPEQSSLEKYDASAASSGMNTVSSAYLFSAERGVAFLAPTPVSLDEYKYEIDHHKGPGGPPDPLIYQYRNVAIDPPLVLRPPQPFTYSSRFVVQGKPEASSVHDDGGGFSGGGSDSDQGHGGNKNLPKGKKNNSNLKFGD